jgi:hypothetical protein
MTPDDDAEIDRRARDIRDAVNACWKALADLMPEEKAVALSELGLRLAMEEATHIVERH